MMLTSDKVRNDADLSNVRNSLGGVGRLDEIQSHFN